MCCHGRMRTLITEHLSVTIDPDDGACIRSLLDRTTGRQWVLGGSDSPRQPPVVGNYTAHPVIGWDEMAPTVDPAVISHGDIHVDAPDHGEVWSAPWTVLEASDTSLTTRIDGTLMPFRLTRTASVAGASLTLAYRLESLGGVLPVLWAAHPALDASRGTTLTLPSHVHEVHGVHEGRDPEPFRRAVTGPLAVADLAPHGEGLMLYPDQDIRVDTALLTDSDGCFLRMQWAAEPDSAGTIDHMAIWMDNHLYSAGLVIAPEPMTGYYDSAARALANGTIALVERDKPWRWRVTVTVGKD